MLQNQHKAFQFGQAKIIIKLYNTTQQCTTIHLLCFHVLMNLYTYLYTYLSLYLYLLP